MNAFIPLSTIETTASNESLPIEETIILLKPDWEKEGASIHLLESLAAELDRHSLQLAEATTKTLSEAELLQLYPNLSKQEYFKEFLAEMTGSPVLVFRVKGPNAIKAATTIKGKKCDPSCAHSETCLIDGDMCVNSGTMRQMYSTYDKRYHNVMHTPDDMEEALDNIALFFPHS